jgi:hypothetical protein
MFLQGSTQIPVDMLEEDVEEDVQVRAQPPATYELAYALAKAREVKGVVRRGGKGRGGKNKLQGYSKAKRGATSLFRSGNAVVEKITALEGSTSHGHRSPEVDTAIGRVLNGALTPLAITFRSLLSPAQQLVFDEVIVKNQSGGEIYQSLGDALGVSSNYARIIALDLKEVYTLVVARNSTDLREVSGLAPLRKWNGQLGLHGNTYREYMRTGVAT